VTAWAAVCILFAGFPALAGTLSRSAFTEYSILSSNAEMAHRMLSPLTSAKIPSRLAETGKQLRDQPIDLSQESFLLYVPSPPRTSYGLIVFVSPWRDSRLPDGWGSVLDRYGIIFVSALRSGNEQSTLGRRLPLALLAEQNVVRRYPVDPTRIYVSGFSGGARVATRLAVGYPDVFRGAILNSGADIIGDDGIPLPPRDLAERFQSASSLVYIAGGHDEAVLSVNHASMRSARAWCAFNVSDEVMPFAFHVPADTTTLSRALDTLAKPASADPVQLTTCRSGIDAELQSELQKVETFLANGRRDEAQTLLNHIDARFGGLAAPRILDLAKK
jgi:pimeloyl-ACP methyl ester carboxylesterase